ncbi:hypothetical protein D3C86_1783760 [compost metagenome]
MPASGAVRPALSELRISLLSPALGSSDWMTLLMAPMVPIRPQKVPSRPRNTSRPTR